MKELLDYIYKEQKELSTFSGIGALLGWDHMTYMPQEGDKERSEQISLISRLAHEKFTDDKLYENVKKLNEKYSLNNLGENDKAVVIRLEKDIEKSRKVPSDFVERMSKTTTLAYSAWQQARNKNDFSIFSNHLDQIITLEKEYCGYINLPGCIYNNLLDDYEEGMTVEKLDDEFNFLKSELKTIENIIEETSKKVSDLENKK